MDQNKRLLLAFVISLGVLLVFQKVQPPKNTNTDKPIVSNTLAQNKAIDQEEVTLNTSQIAPEVHNGDAREEKTISRSTDMFNLGFSSTGGALDSIFVVDPQDPEKKTPLLLQKNPMLRPFLLINAQFPELSNGQYKIVEKQDTVDLINKIPGKLLVTKTVYTPKNSNYMRLDITIQNISSEEIPFPYLLIGPSGFQETGTVKGRNFIEATADINGDPVRKHSTKQQWEQEGHVSWISLKNRYLVFIVKPEEGAEGAIVGGKKGTDLVTGLKKGTRSILPGKSITDEYVIYVGPLSEDKLKIAGEGFEKTINYGFFAPISRILLKTLRVFHKYVRNWGFAIILLTILVNFISFPLTKKSFTSMHQMKKIQPHMQKLKDLHKDNPQKLNKEMMDLYKQYNVNPFGGCLPMLLQIPIFIALYQGLIRAVELSGATFLWINDLAKPDAVPLPITLPLIGNHINILPIMMAVMMLMQQKIQGNAANAMTEEQAQQQKMMLVMMPILFGFMFYSMPSGLVLYWLTNTSLMTAEQWFLRKTFSEEK